MIKIENKVFKNVGCGKNYADLLCIGMQSSPVKGMTIQQMRVIQKDLDYLEKNIDEPTIELPLERLQETLEVVEALPWKVFNKELIEFSDYITGLLK